MFEVGSIFVQDKIADAVVEFRGPAREGERAEGLEEREREQDMVL